MQHSGVNVTIRRAGHGRTGWSEGGEVEYLLSPKTHLRPVLDMADKVRTLTAAFAAPLQRVQAVSAQLAEAGEGFRRRQEALYAELRRAPVVPIPATRRTP